MKLKIKKKTNKTFNCMQLIKIKNITFNLKLIVTDNL